MEWFHCGRCGSFFQAPPGDPDERVCTKCGRDPSLGVEPQPSRAQSDGQKAEAAQDDDAQDHREHHEGRRKRRNSLVARLVFGWLLTMVVVVVSVKLIWPDDPPEKQTADSVANSVKGTAGDEAVVKLDKALPDCSVTLTGYLGASTDEERNQFVKDPLATAGRMSRFHSLNPLPRLEPSTLRNTENSLLSIPGRQAIETRWKSTDGLIIDCVFVQEDGEWRIDWEHFARYQPYPWSLFVSGEGPPEAEFRLLARQRVTRDGPASSHMDLVISPPRFGHPRETGQPNIEIILRRDSPDGRILTAGFKQRTDGVSPFGSTLAGLEEDDMLRVRVTLRRSSNDQPEGGKWKFDLIKVNACHWLSTDDPGVKPEPETP